MEWVDGENRPSMSKAAEWADLVIVSGDRGRGWLARSRERIDAFMHVLERGGRAYLEYGTLGGQDPHALDDWSRLQLQDESGFFRLMPCGANPRSRCRWTTARR